jgi:DNA-binding MarR family transcriptional regulator
LDVERFEDCIVFLLAKAYQKAHGNLKKRLHPYGLTPIQNLILEALREEDGLSAGDIGKRLVLDNATLSGVLERLAERGWIEKQTDPNDKRLLRIYLTNKAKALQSELGEERDNANEEILRTLSVEEKVLLKRLLRDVQA